MPKLSTFTERTLNVTVDAVGEPIHLVIRPYAWTLETESKMLEAVTSAEDGRNRTSDFFSDVVISWDIMDDEGKPIPIDRENLAQFPTVLLGELLEGVKKALTFRKQ